jgi:hypothetical protein
MRSKRKNNCHCNCNNKCRSLRDDNKKSNGKDNCNGKDKSRSFAALRNDKQTLRCGMTNKNEKDT